MDGSRVRKAQTRVAMAGPGSSAASVPSFAWGSGLKTPVGGNLGGHWPGPSRIPAYQHLFSFFLTRPIIDRNPGLRLPNSLSLERRRVSSDVSSTAGHAHG